MRTGGRATLLALAVSAVAIISIAVPVRAGESEVARLFELTNLTRARHGLPELVADARLSQIAAGHSVRMQAAGTIFHDDRLASRLRGVPWTTADENVGVGPTVERVHEELLASRVHRDNILGSSDRVGMATTRSGAEVYVVQIFVAAPDSPSALSGGRIRPIGTVRAEDGTLVPCWFYGHLRCPD